MPGTLVPVPQSSSAQPPVSQAVVQSIPGREGINLNAALVRLGNDPRDVGALVEAGNAALAMGDVDASIGFYSRADQVSPGNPRVKAGLAGALVRNENPFDAIPLFDEAERAGALDTALVADRGLAYDLVGDNVTAQRYYRQALAGGSSDEVSRRLALSQAIGGDRRSAEMTLAPLLQRQDKGAWRTRAFALAILGQVDEAVSIAGTTLPSDIAASISPYLRYMPRLTPAQQAAAANFGHFPRAAEIGRDDPRVARYARPSPAVVAVAPPPPGRQSSRNSRSRNNAAASSQPATTARSGGQIANAAATPPRIAPPEIVPTREVTRDGSGQGPSLAVLLPAPRSPNAPVLKAPETPLPPPPAAATVRVTAELPPLNLPPPPTARPAAESASAKTGAPAMPVLAVAPAPASATPAPSAAELGFVIVDRAPPQTSPPIATPAAPSRVAAAAAPRLPMLAAAPAIPATSLPAAAVPVVQAKPPPESAPPRRSLADAFSDLARPSVDITPANGAVDIRTIRPARAQGAGDTAAKPAVAAKSVKPPPPSHPSRIWVQVATGRDKAALAFDWRRMNRQSADVFRGKQSFTSVWGQTNRLLTGPFATEAAANAFIVQLRRAEVDGAFVFNSPAGQVVDRLAAR